MLGVTPLIDADFPNADIDLFAAGVEVALPEPDNDDLGFEAGGGIEPNSVIRLFFTPEPGAALGVSDNLECNLGFRPKVETAVGLPLVLVRIAEERPDAGVSF